MPHVHNKEHGKSGGEEYLASLCYEDPNFVLFHFILSVFFVCLSQNPFPPPENLFKKIKK